MKLIDSNTSFKLALIEEDLNGDQTQKSFAKVCKHAEKAISPSGIGSEFFTQYSAIPQESSEFFERVMEDMLDNYMIAGFVLKKMNLHRGAPLIAWASLNKMKYEGFKGEIATIRSLMWAGFDPSARSGPEGATALHSMCNLRWGYGAHPRAVRHLIQGGADVNAIGGNGDTPLTTLSGNQGWNDQIDQCFRLLLDAGARPDIASTDGTTARGLLNEMQRDFPDVLRAKLIDDMKS